MVSVGLLSVEKLKGRRWLGNRSHPFAKGRQAVMVGGSSVEAQSSPAGAIIFETAKSHPRTRVFKFVEAQHAQHKLPRLDFVALSSGSEPPGMYQNRFVARTLKSGARTLTATAGSYSATPVICIQP